MTEKNYGGSTSHGFKGGAGVNSSFKKELVKKSKESKEEESGEGIDAKSIKMYKKAGEIAFKSVDFAREIVKKGVLLREIAEKIEEKIIQLGGKPAFPVNLSINEIAAHSTPSFDDSSVAHGLIKVDIGVHVDGHVADTAFSVDLENYEENRKLIKVAEMALKKASEKAGYDVALNEIGGIIEAEIKLHGFSPIQTLSGHSIEIYNLHSGVNVPNYDNGSNIKMEEGVYAIEPFSTNGLGAVRDGKLSGIYHLEEYKNVRDSFARDVLTFIYEEYKTLPFCSRWIHKKFGSRGLLVLGKIEQAGLLHHYAQLVEKGNGKVAQAENTFIITEKEKIVVVQ